MLGAPPLPAHCLCACAHFSVCAVAGACQVLSQDPGMYRLFIKADDNARLWINQELLIDKWWNPAVDSYGDVQLTAGRLNDVRIEYRDRYVPPAPAVCVWGVSRLVFALTPSNVPSRLLPADPLWCRCRLAARASLTARSGGSPPPATEVGLWFP